jgi:hypothetical protein
VFAISGKRGHGMFALFVEDLGLQEISILSVFVLSNQPSSSPLEKGEL